jgi:hypothetical protein
MRAAPPAQASSGGAGLWRGAQLGLYALTAGVSVGWAAAWGIGVGARAATLAMLAALAACMLAARWLRACPCRLVWDGAEWTLHPESGDAVRGQPEVMMAFGGGMLLRFMPAAVASAPAFRARWLPLTRREAGAGWHGLCAALYATVPADPQRRRAARLAG